jgi:enoyl-CoA hydratase/carnithine racemase
MSTEPEILVEKKAPILYVTFNRPEVRNAITAEMERQIDHILDEAEDDDEVRVVVFRGKGKVFSAGRDFRTYDPATHRHQEIPRLNRAWYFRKPVVVGVHGFVGPVAWRLIACFDFVLAVAGTRFSFEAARSGGDAPGGSPLAFQLPMQVLKKLSLMGGWMDAEQALQFQVVQRLVPTVEELDVELDKWARHLAEMPTEQVQNIKISIHRLYELMGMAQMELVQNRVSGHGNSSGDVFYEAVKSKGLGEALKGRDSKFDPDVARV